MKNESVVAAIIGLLAMLPASAMAELVESSGSVKIVRETTLKYLLFEPADTTPDEPLPLLLFLHGAGERGDNLELVKKHGPPKLAAAGKAFPFLVLAPQCPADSWWDSRELLALLDHVITEHNVDTDRVYLTGLSMGGYGTWDLVAKAPDRFAAIAPICGGGIPYRTRHHAHVPTWVFHGTDDPVVPFVLSELMVGALRSKNADVKLTAYRGVSHDSWTAAYETEELFDWLLQHKRAKRQPK